MAGYKIAVAGTGYVGLSIAVLLSQHHKVTAVDIVPEKIEAINNKESPIKDNEIESYLKNKPLNLTATQDAVSAYQNADYIVICTPTNYDPARNFFDTSSIDGRNKHSFRMQIQSHHCYQINGTRGVTLRLWLRSIMI